MGGLLDVIGVPGFMANACQLLDDANDDQAKWTALVQHWWQAFRAHAVGTADLFPMVEDEGLLEGILGDGNEASRRIRLGRPWAGSGMPVTAARDRRGGQGPVGGLPVPPRVPGVREIPP